MPIDFKLFLCGFEEGLSSSVDSLVIACRLAPPISERIRTACFNLLGLYLGAEAKLRTLVHSSQIGLQDKEWYLEGYDLAVQMSLTCFETTEHNLTPETIANMKREASLMMDEFRRETQGNSSQGNSSLVQ